MGFHVTLVSFKFCYEQKQPKLGARGHHCFAPCGYFGSGYNIELRNAIMNF